MASISRLTIACAFALCCTLAFTFPSALYQLLGRHPALTALGLGRDPVRDGLDARRRRELYLLGRTTKARSRVVWGVIHGRWKLLESAARFQQLQRRKSAAVTAGDEAVDLCRQVVHWVEVEEQRDGSLEIKRALCRLRAELREVQRRQGRVELPPVPPAVVAEIRREASGL